MFYLSFYFGLTYFVLYSDSRNSDSERSHIPKRNRGVEHETATTPGAAAFRQT